MTQSHSRTEINPKLQKLDFILRFFSTCSRFRRSSQNLKCGHGSWPGFKCRIGGNTYGVAYLGHVRSLFRAPGTVISENHPTVWCLLGASNSRDKCLDARNRQLSMSTYYFCRCESGTVQYS